MNDHRVLSPRTCCFGVLRSGPRRVRRVLQGTRVFLIPEPLSPTRLLPSGAARECAALVASYIFASECVSARSRAYSATRLEWLHRLIIRDLLPYPPTPGHPAFERYMNVIQPARAAFLDKRRSRIAFLSWFLTDAPRPRLLPSDTWPDRPGPTLGGSIHAGIPGVPLEALSPTPYYRDLQARPPRRRFEPACLREFHELPATLPADATTPFFVSYRLEQPLLQPAFPFAFPPVGRSTIDFD
jgi:hypothetical protein